MVKRNILRENRARDRNSEKEHFAFKVYFITKPQPRCRASESAVGEGVEKDEERGRKKEDRSVHRCAPACITFVEL